MASDAHAPHGQPAHAPSAERARPHQTHEMVMTTRGKRQLTLPYPVEVAVEAGQCTLDVVDPMHVYVVSPDKPGESRVSVTPLEPNDDYLPAQIHVVVQAPAMVVDMGEEEPK